MAKSSYYCEKCGEHCFPMIVDGEVLYNLCDQCLIDELEECSSEDYWNIEDYIDDMED